MFGNFTEEELRKMNEDVGDVEFQSDVDYAGGALLEGKVDPEAYKYVGSTGVPIRWTKKGAYLPKEYLGTYTERVPSSFKGQGGNYTMEPGEVVGLDTGAIKETAAHEYTHKLLDDKPSHGGFFGGEENAVRRIMLKEAKTFSAFKEDIFFEMNQEKHGDKMRTKRLKDDNKEDLELIIKQADSLLHHDGYRDGADKHIKSIESLNPEGLDKRMKQRKNHDWEVWKKENPTWHKIIAFLQDDEEVERNEARESATAGKITKRELGNSYRDRWANFKKIAELKLDALETK